MALTRYGRTTIFEKVQRGEFPVPLKFASGRGGAVRFRVGDVRDYLKNPLAYRAQKAA